ncbi:MAG: hypothetical protein KDJ65_20895 [Anaerolineae bacterium]|nr:hypothetical protein [Anaerolineae bacterium]
MTFDINQLDKIDYDTEGEEALAAYQDALLERFYQSAEGQSFIETHPDIEMGFWAAQLMYYGYAYEGITIPRMTVGDVEIIVTSLFPRKISLFSAEDAEDAIPELIAFWEFLKREYKQSNADRILKYLHQIGPTFKEMMMDTSNFGMAKSFFMMGQSAGYDMTNEADSQRFIAEYNAGLLGQESRGLSLSGPDRFFGSFGDQQQGSAKRRGSSHTKKKNARKAAKASRKKNRKKRK